MSLILPFRRRGPKSSWKSAVSLLSIIRFQSPTATAFLWYFASPRNMVGSPQDHPKIRQQRTTFKLRTIPYILP